MYTTTIKLIFYIFESHVAICNDCLDSQVKGAHVQRAAGVVADRDARVAVVGPHDKDWWIEAPARPCVRWVPHWWLLSPSHSLWVPCPVSSMNAFSNFFPPLFVIAISFHSIKILIIIIIVIQKKWKKWRFLV